MIVSISEAIVTIPGDGDYLPLSLRVSADNNWTPTWQGTATFALGAAPKVDPTKYPKALIRWWYGDPTDQWGSPADPPLVLNCLLYIRSSVTDDIAGTVTLTFLSAEILTMDDANASTTDYQPGAITARQLTKFALDRLVTKHGITYDIGGIAGTALPAATTVWKAGQNSDSWIRPAIRTQDLELFQDMNLSVSTGDGLTPYLSTWLVTNPGKGASGNGNAIYGRNILESRFGVDIDDPGWADAVTAVYSWTDSAGASRRKAYRSFVGNGSTYKRNVTINYDAADPGYDPTPGLLVGRQRRGSTARLATTPGLSNSSPTGSGQWGQHQLGEDLAVQRRDGSIYHATVSRLEWSYPANRIDFGLASVTPGGSLHQLPTP